MAQSGMTQTGTARTGTARTGSTRSAGWEIGVSRMLDHPLPVVWDFLNSVKGKRIWLGDGVGPLQPIGTTYETTDGTIGEVRSFRARDRVRLTWRPANWKHDSTVQLAVTATDGRTRLTFHQERLADEAERDRQRTHWKRVMDEVTAALG